jgi:hypothetical protein
VQERRLQTLDKRSKRLPRIRFTRKGDATEFLEGFDLLVTLLAQLLLDKALG